VLFRKAFRQKRIANGAGERDVHGSAQMHVSEFSVSEAELPPAKAMWMNRYVRPCRYLFLELSQLCHVDHTLFVISMTGESGAIQDSTCSERLVKCDCRQRHRFVLY
jgi:hypothetical protein